MRLNELISFVRSIDQLPDVDSNDDPNDGPATKDSTADAELDRERIPSRSRAPIPGWLSGQFPTVPLGAGDVLGVEPDVRVDQLPADLQTPNPGIDVLAYYLPFHTYEKDWGIYLRASGVLRAASIIADGSLYTGNTERYLRNGRELLFQHERFHFFCEVACARAEVIARRPLYRQYFNLNDATAHEEALANAFAVSALDRRDGFTEVSLLTWLKNLGAGYEDFELWAASRFAKGCRRATQYMLCPLRPGGRPRMEPAEFLFDRLKRFTPRVYIVFDTDLLSTMRPFPREDGVQVFVHTREHPPPHIHIQIPPGQDIARYEWPSLKPLGDDRALSTANRGKLDAYLEKHGDEIDRKVMSVWPDTRPPTR